MFVQKNEKNFRLKNKRIFLTYPTHLDKQRYDSWFRDKYEYKRPNHVIIAHETGSEGEYPHTHVLIDLGLVIDSTNCRSFDFDGQHPNISAVRDWNSALKYMIKEDKSNEELVESILNPNSGIIGSIVNSDNLLEAIEKNMKKFSDVHGIKTIYDNKPKRPLLNFTWEPTSPWHKDIISLSDNKPDHRSCYWYYETVGCKGKTQLGKYMFLNHDWYITKNLGTARDAATIIEYAISTGWSGNGFYIDLPRGTSDHKSVYEAVEMLLDGFITSQKYKGGTTVFDDPHVVVVANFPPKLNKYTLSNDRWKIFKIVDGEGIAMSPEDAKKERDDFDGLIENDDGIIEF